MARFGAVAEICKHSFLERFIGANAVVFDLGSFRGEFAHEMIRRYGCRVVSVEPVKQLYDKIARHPKLELLPVAVGGTNHMIELNVFANRCASALGPVSAEEKMVAQPVEMITIAELRRRTRTAKVDLLKLDIEGAEIDLFAQSSDEELQAYPQITLEFHDWLYASQVANVIDVLERMRRIGFWVIPFSLDHSDVLFLNRQTGVSPAEVVYLRSVVKYSMGIARRFRNAFGN